MSESMRLWDAWKSPPADALKTIQAGRLKGKSDINPQWRFQALTEQLGPCGEGWRYEIVQLWTEPIVATGEVAAFARVDLFVSFPLEAGGRGWHCAIPGIGGSMLVENQKHGPYVNDEAYKMAVTDALSVAMKALGVAADIYRGFGDSSKYSQREAPAAPAGGGGTEAKKTMAKVMAKLEEEFGECGLYDKGEDGNLLPAAKLKLEVLRKTYSTTRYKEIEALPGLVKITALKFLGAIEEVQDAQRKPETGHAKQSEADDESLPF